MPQLVACPHCSSQVVNDGTLAGSVASCPQCRRPFSMPQLVAQPIQGDRPAASVSPGVAALASFLIPGAGQILNGQVMRGLLFFAGAVAFGLLSLALIGLPFLFLLWLWSIGNAYDVANRALDVE